MTDLARGFTTVIVADFWTDHHTGWHLIRIVNRDGSIMEHSLFDPFPTTEDVERFLNKPLVRIAYRVSPETHEITYDYYTGTAIVHWPDDLWESNPLSDKVDWMREGF